MLFDISLKEQQQVPWIWDILTAVVDQRDLQFTIK